jgi:hypothetical protein
MTVVVDDVEEDAGAGGSDEGAAAAAAAADAATLRRRCSGSVQRGRARPVVADGPTDLRVSIIVVDVLGDDDCSGRNQSKNHHTPARARLVWRERSRERSNAREVDESEHEGNSTIGAWLSTQRSRARTPT